jgi:hypothetical protein
MNTIHTIFEYPLITLMQSDVKQHLINIFAVYGFIELIKNIKKINSKPQSEPKPEQKVCTYYPEHASESEPESEPEPDDPSDPDYVVTSTFKRKLRKRKKII